MTLSLAHILCLSRCRDFLEVDLTCSQVLIGSKTQARLSFCNQELGFWAWLDLYIKDVNLSTLPMKLEIGGLKFRSTETKTISNKRSPTASN